MDMSRISVGTYPLKDRPLNEALDVLTAAGFRRVDLLACPQHFSIDPSEQDPKGLMAMAAEKGVEIANLATYSGRGFVKEDKAQQEQEFEDIKRTIDLAAMFGARTIRVYRIGSPNERVEHIDMMVPWYQKVCEYAAEKKVFMGVENHGGVISGSAQLCREIAEKVGSPYFGVLYDPCNLLTAGADYKEAFDTMRDHIVHVHLKDGTPDHESAKSTMLGEGQVDAPWVISKLREIGYEGDVMLEYEVETVPPEEGLKIWHDTIAGYLAN
jgi:sugar phosphate isomerase/epimerase